MSPHKTTAALAKALGVPRDATKAVLLLRAGDAPMLHVTRMVTDQATRRMQALHTMHRLELVDLGQQSATAPAPGRMRRFWRWFFDTSHLKRETQREWEDRQL